MALEIIQRCIFTHPLASPVTFHERKVWLHLHSHERLGWGVSHCQPGSQGQGMEKTDGHFTVVHGGKKRGAGLNKRLRMNTQKTFSP